ncbi:hypothetical protein [Neptunomonas antarctica]|uniref:Uncharacterized protein n=1 Tax=Neptunomonas antarctica TaxID=619304 RepID=A0A1N7IU66_9GAMM|nr:hypothetical protein [Neptunomonas antarctica]SIS40638.1 hypothetical protein SAMN05421760_101139 [Neptunomonas antarctica]
MEYDYDKKDFPPSGIKDNHHKWLSEIQVFEGVTIHCPCRALFGTHPSNRLANIE